MSDKTQTVESDGLLVVDRPTGKNETETKDLDFMELLLSGKSVEKKLKTSRGEFTARYPLGKDRLRIDQIKAIRRGGIPGTSFDEYAEFNNNVWSTLDVVIVDGPDWYKNAKEQKPNGWTWEDEPDEELIIELFELVRSFRTTVANKIQQSKLGKPSGKVKQAADKPNVGDGAFSGLTNGPQGAGTDRPSNKST